VLRFLGLRRDEGNKVQAQDVLDHGTEMWLVVRYHASDIKSNRVLAVPPALWQSLRDAIKGTEPTDYVLCNRLKRGCYDRRRLFQRVSRTAGVKITAKDLRDYFASIMDDPTVASQMLGHTSLRTTAIYVRQVQQRMVAGVAKLGANLGGQIHLNKLPKPLKSPASNPQLFRKYLESLAGRSAAW
jgi:integrase